MSDFEQNPPSRAEALPPLSELLTDIKIALSKRARLRLKAAQLSELSASAGDDTDETGITREAIIISGEKAKESDLNHMLNLGLSVKNMRHRRLSIEPSSDRVYGSASLRIDPETKLELGDNYRLEGSYNAAGVEAMGTIILSQAVIIHPDQAQTAPRPLTISGIFADVDGSFIPLIDINPISG